MEWFVQEFRNRRCLVSGATGGMGLAICRAFYEAGAEVIAVDVASSSSEDAPWSRLLSCDITSEGDLSTLAENLGEGQSLDVLVNAAGIMRKYAVGETDWAEWDRAYAVNCRGALRLTEMVLDQLRRSDRGRIINIASMTASIGLPTYAPYSSAKAALLNASRVLAAELAGTGITVNTISPGWVSTPMLEPLFTRMEQLHDLPPGEGRAYVERLIPQHRLVQPEEVAAATLFLAGAGGGAITGHDLAMDGGLTTLFAPGVHAV